MAKLAFGAACIALLFVLSTSTETSDHYARYMAYIKCLTVTRRSPYTAKASGMMGWDRGRQPLAGACGDVSRTLWYDRSDPDKAALSDWCAVHSPIDGITIKNVCRGLNMRKTTLAFQYYFVNRVFATYGRMPVVSDSSDSQSLLSSVSSSDEIPVCPSDVSQRPIDFLLMADSSGSLSQRQFTNIKRSFLLMVRNGIRNISAESTRVGMMTFASTPHTVFSFDECNNKQCVLHRIRQGNKGEGAARIVPALRHATNMFREGARSCSRKIFLMLDAGVSPQDGYSRAADELHSAATEGVVVGIAYKLNETMIRYIASQPTNTHVYWVKDTERARSLTRFIEFATLND